MGADFTFLKGNIETIILSALYENDKYGYELAKEIKEKTSNKYEIKQPTLYAYLRRLEEDDLIVSYWGENSNGGRRRYYKITKNGKSNYEQFMSEWNFQKSVLDDLVDSDATIAERTQNDVTPMFGRKSSRRKNRDVLKSSLDEQDEIARRLSELLSVQNSEPVHSNDAATPVESYDAPSANDELKSNDQNFDDTAATNVQDEPIAHVAAQTEELSKSRFDVNQENAEVFMQRFDERAKEVRDRDVGGDTDGENYQHVLLGVLDGQLDNVDSSSPDESRTYYEGVPSGLEEVADNFAKEGIRMRIYNHTTAVYKSKMLIPLSKVLCQTAWITYALAFIYYGILALTSTWVPFIITLGALSAVPIAFSIHAIIDPTRRDKPAFKFKAAIITAVAVSAIIVLCSVGFSALDNLEFSNFADVSVKILIPTGIAILLPVSISVFYLLYKKY